MLDMNLLGNESEYRTEKKKKEGKIGSPSSPSHT